MGLKAGIIENEKITPNKQGVPQGSPISPTIFNCVMNGIENKIMQVEGTYPIRFADDIAVFSDTPDKLEKVNEYIEEFLNTRGLKINEEKTSITSIENGVDFLGYNIREYPNSAKTGLKGKATKKGILLV